MFSSNIFWRLLALVGVIGLFYVGHGLHTRTTGEALPFESVAKGVQMNPSYSPWMSGNKPIAITSSADGNTLYFWGPKLAPEVASPLAGIHVVSVATAR